MTEEESQTIMGFKYSETFPLDNLIDSSKIPLTQSLPTSVNWLTANKMGPVINQGACGSCWAQSAANSFESALAIKENRAVGTKTVSIQHLVDCDINDMNYGCQGGNQQNAYHFIKKKWLLLHN